MLQERKAAIYRRFVSTHPHCEQTRVAARSRLSVVSTGAVWPQSRHVSHHDRTSLRRRVLSRICRPRLFQFGRISSSRVGCLHGLAPSLRKVCALHLAPVDASALGPLLDNLARYACEIRYLARRADTFGQECQGRAACFRVADRARHILQFATNDVPSQDCSH
jgi:hypothetical protein